MQNDKKIADRIIRIKELEQAMGVSKATVYNYIKKGSFPPSFKIDSNSTSRNSAAGWRLSDINEWLKSKGLNSLQ